MSGGPSHYPEPEDPVSAFGALPYYEPRSGRPIDLGTRSASRDIVFEAEDDAPSGYQSETEPPGGLDSASDVSAISDTEDNDDDDDERSAGDSAFRATLEDLVDEHDELDDDDDDDDDDDVAGEGALKRLSSGLTRARGRGRGSRQGRGRGRGHAASRGSGRARGRPRMSSLNQPRRRVPRGEGARGGGKGVPRGPKPPPDPGPEYHAIMNRANHAYLQQNWDQVGELCHELITMNPSIWSAYGLMADVLKEKGDKIGEFATMFSALSVCKDIDAMWHMLRLGEELQQENSAEVTSSDLMSIYSAIIDRDSENFDARKGRIRLLEQAGHAGRASRECEKLVRTRPHDLELLEDLARLALQAMSRLGNAIHYYENTIDHLENEFDDGGDSGFSFDDLNHYAELLLAVKDYSRGLVEVKRIARWICGRKDEDYWNDYQANDCEWDDYNEPRRETVPNFRDNQDRYSEDQYGMGLPLELRAKLGLFRVHLGSQNFPEALRHFEFFAEEDDAPAYADLFIDIANALYDARLYDDALRFYLPVMSTDYVGKYRLNIKVARALAIAGKLDDAVTYYERAIASYPGSDEHTYRAEVARLYRELGQFDKARAHADALVRKRTYNLPTGSQATDRQKVSSTQKRTGDALQSLLPVGSLETKGYQFAVESFDQGAASGRKRASGRRLRMQLSNDDLTTSSRPSGSKYPILPDAPRQYVDIAPKTSGRTTSRYVPLGNGEVKGDTDPGHSNAEDEDVDGDDDYEHDDSSEASSQDPMEDRDAYALQGILPDPAAIAARLAQTLQPRKTVVKRRKRTERKTRPQGTSIAAVRAQMRVKKRQQRLEQDEQRRQGVRSLYDQAVDLDEAVDAGDESAQDDWIIIVTKLLEFFKTTKEFYPRDKAARFLGYGAEARARSNKAMPNEPLTEAERAAEAIYRTLPGNQSIDFEATFKIPDEYEGVTFDKWLDLFCRLALLHAQRGSLNECFEALSWAKEANIFRHEPVFLDRLHVVGFACAIQLNSEQHLCEEPRHFLRSHQSMSDPFRLLAALNRMYDGEPSWYRGGPMQKFLMRQLKAIDYALMTDEQREKFGFTEAEGPSYPKATTKRTQRSDQDRPGNPKGLTSLDPLPIYTYGEIMGSGKGSSWQNALYYFLRALAVKPAEPLILLSISVSYLVGSTKRHVDNRHQYVIQGLSFLHEYKKYRMQDIETAARQNYQDELTFERRSARLKHQRLMETTFNEGRAWHFLGLIHLCIPAYEKVLKLEDLPVWRTEGSQDGGQVLEDGAHHEQVLRMGVNAELQLLEEPDFKREAAFALQQIYALQGHMSLARELGEKYLVF